MQARPRLESLEERAVPATFTVTLATDTAPTAGGTPGDLRYVLTQANADTTTVGADTINFALPGAGFQTISLAAALPAVTRQVVIDGFSQPGYAGAPVVVLDGRGAGAFADGLTLGGSFSSSAGSTVRGLGISGFSGNGIVVASGGRDVIQGNIVANNGLAGVLLQSGGLGDVAGVTVGGTAAGNGPPDSRVANAIVNNGTNGVEIDGTADSVLGNAIFGNAGLGIALNGVGNDALAAPSLTGVTRTGNTTTVAGSLAATPNSTYRVEFFTNPTVRSAGGDQGRTFLGAITVVTGTSGNTSFVANALPAVAGGTGITATATDISAPATPRTGDTSMFSAAIAVPTGSVASTTFVMANPNPVAGGGAVTLTASVGATFNPPNADIAPLNGSVTFSQDGRELGTVPLSANQAILTLTTLPVGSDTITATYSGDNTFQPSAASTVVRVNGAATTTTVTAAPNPSTTGAAVTLTAAITSTTAGTATGSVTFSQGLTTLGTAAVTGGSATLTTSILPVGIDAITATYSGDGTFAASTGTGTATVAAPAGTAPTVLTVTPSPATSTAGQLVSLNTGITSPTTTVTVNAAGTAASTTTLAATPATPTAGQPVTLTATVTAAGAGGFVTFTIPSGPFGGTTNLGTVAVTGGTATLTTNRLPQGTTNVTATFSGTAATAGSSGTATVTVAAPAGTAATTTTVVAAPNPTTAGQTVTLTANLTNLSGFGGGVLPQLGTVTFTTGFFFAPVTLGTANVVNGVATLTTTALPQGTDTVTATYSGDLAFIGSTGTVSVTVAAPTGTAATRTVVTGLPATTAVGTPVTLTANVVSTTAGAVTGSVDFSYRTAFGTVFLGSGTVGANGVATFTTADLPAGVDTIFAAYGGDNTFAASDSRITGSVTFTVGTAVLGTVAVFAGQSATLNTNALPVGTDAVTATYSGDGTYAGTTATTIVTVAPAPGTAATTTTLTAAPNPATAGREQVTLTATVASATAGTPTGTVTFTSGGVTLGTVAATGGPVTLVTASLPAGINTVTATYSGDGTFAGSAGATAETVNATPGTVTTSTVLTVAPNPTAAGQPVTLAAFLFIFPTGAPGSALPTGTVTFTQGSVVLGTVAVPPVNSADRSVRLTLATLPVGFDTITATYNGDGTFLPSAGSVVVTVGTLTTTTVTAAPVAPTFGQPITLTAAVGPAGSGAVNGTLTGTVTFFSGTVVLGTAPVVNGVATLTNTLLPAGTSTVTAIYGGNATFAASFGTTALTVAAAPTVVTVPGQAAAFSAAVQFVTLTAAVSSPNGIVNEGFVTFTVRDGSGAAVGSPVFGNVANGVAAVPFALTAGQAGGTFTVTAAYADGAGNFLTGTGTGILAVAPAPVSPPPPVVPPVSPPPPVVLPATVTAAVSRTVTFSPAQQMFTLAAGVAGPAGPVNQGTVTFTVFTAAGAPVGVPVTAAVVNGIAAAAFTLPGDTAPGTDLIQAVYSGAANLAGSQDATHTLSVVGQPFYVVGPDAGGGQAVQAFGLGGSRQGTPVAAFDATVTGGVRVASADFNADGVPDLVVGTGPGVATRVRVLDGKTGAELFAVQPFEASFTGGVFVAAGDLTGDGTPELVITPDQGGGPRVEVFDGKSFQKLADFFGIADPDFRGGARAAVGDVNGAGFGFLAVAAGFGGGPRVAVFDARSVAGNNPTRLIPDFFAFEPGLRNGAFVAAGDLTGAGFADLVFGGGPGGGPRVRVVDTKLLAAAGGFASLDDANAKSAQLANFFVGDPAARGGARVAVKNLGTDPAADLIAGGGTGSGVQVYAGKALTAGGPATAIDSFDAFPGFAGGVFVG